MKRITKNQYLQEQKLNIDCKPTVTGAFNMTVTVQIVAVQIATLLNKEIAQG